MCAAAAIWHERDNQSKTVKLISFTLTRDARGSRWRRQCNVHMPSEIVQRNPCQRKGTLLLVGSYMPAHTYMLTIFAARARTYTIPTVNARHSFVSDEFDVCVACRPIHWHVGMCVRSVFRTDLACNQTGCQCVRASYTVLHVSHTRTSVRYASAMHACV